MINFSKILVIGSNSFSGSNFINKSLMSGNRVIGISRSTEVPIEFSRYDNNPNKDNFFFHKLDINNNCSDILQLISESQSDVIVNFAAQSMVSQSWKTPEDWYQTNVVSFSKLVSGISKIPTVKKFIQFSTPEVYGSTEGWIKESFNFSPNTPYAISRAAADWHLKASFENYSFPVIFTRASNVYGEHQQLYRIIPRTILSILLGQKLPLQGGGKSVRSFIHIDDVSIAINKIIKFGKIGESYHISTNKMISILDLVSEIARQMEINVESIINPVPERPGKDFAYQLNSEKIRFELGWQDEISLEEGLQSTILWVKSNLNFFRHLPIEYSHKR